MINSDGKMNLLHEEESFVVVEKVSGFLSVPERGEENFDSVASRVKENYPVCIAQPAVHRLDMDTSGILVLARTKEAHRDLSIQFQERQTEKKYYALLDGLLEESLELLNCHLGWTWIIDHIRFTMKFTVKSKITNWQKLSVENGLTKEFCLNL